MMTVHLGSPRHPKMVCLKIIIRVISRQTAQPVLWKIIGIGPWRTTSTMNVWYVMYGETKDNRQTGCVRELPVILANYLHPYVSVELVSPVRIFTYP